MKNSIIGWALVLSLAVLDFPAFAQTLINNGEAVGGLSGSTGNEKFYKIRIPSGQAKLEIRTQGGSGDCDLYVKRGSKPSTSSYDKKSNGGNNNESITINNPSDGWWQILVRGYKSYSGASLTAVYTVSGSAPVVPSVPSGVSASDGTYSDKVRVTWSAVNGAASYEVWRGTVSSSSSASKIGASNSSSFDDTSAAPDVTYRYWVKAKNSAGTSEFSSNDRGFRSAPVSRPDAPAGVSASDGAYFDKVRVTWSAMHGANSYEVWRGTSSSSSSATKLGDATATTFDNVTASPGVVYYYWVKAKNSAGTSEFSSNDRGFRSVPVSRPAAPTGVSASDGSYSDKVRVTWNAVNGATIYEVWRGTASSSSSASKIGTANSASYDDTDAPLNLAYHYWVKAKNSAGTGDFSAGDRGFRSFSAPAAPASVAASDGTYSDKVRVTWNAVNGATSYEVWRNSANSIGTATRVAMLSGTSFDDRAAVQGAIYYYWVKAKNSVGTGGVGNGDVGIRTVQLISGDEISIPFSSTESEVIYKFVVPENRGSAQFVVKPALFNLCEADLYVSYNSLTSWQYYDLSWNSVKQLAIMAPQAGTWFVKVRGRSGMPGLSQYVRLGASHSSAMWDFVRIGMEIHKVSLLTRSSVSDMKRNVDTWLTIHGKRFHLNLLWDKPGAYMTDLASDLDQLVQGGDQVLLVDWKTAAAGLLTGESKWIKPVAEVVTPMLIKIGATRGKLNIVGHSWGSYVLNEIGKAIGGSDAINLAVALDPANSALDYYDVDRINFAANSRFSWGFKSGELFGNAKSTTADQAVLVADSRRDNVLSLVGHGAVCDVYSKLVRNNRAGNLPDRISMQFSPLRTSGPDWAQDKYTFTSIDGFREGYDAILLSPDKKSATRLWYFDTYGREQSLYP